MAARWVAQQTYEWAVRYPEMVKRAAPIAGTAKNTDHDFLFTETLVEAITSDPTFADGHYEQGSDVAAGLKRHAKLWAYQRGFVSLVRGGRRYGITSAGIAALTPYPPHSRDVRPTTRMTR